MGGDSSPRPSTVAGSLIDSDAATSPDPLVQLLHDNGIGCHPTAERGDFRHHEAAAFLLRAAGIRGPDGLTDAEAEDIACRLWKVIDDHDCTVEAKHVRAAFDALRERDAHP